MLLEDAVAIEGGPVELGSSLPGVPARTIKDVSATLLFMVNVFLSNLRDRDCGLYITLTRSSGLSCRVRQLSNGACVVLVPAGLVGRVRTMCRTLLRYWNKEHHVVFLNSPLDPIPEDHWQVPPKLAPLLDHNESGEQFWRHLQELDDSLDLDSRFESDVSELLHLGLVFLLCHEFAHVLFRHFEFVQAIKQTKPNEVDRIRRGLELQADSFAGTWATTIFLEQVGRDNIESLAVGILRQSYVVTVILAMFDAQKKFVGFYDRGDYNHPLIRREVFADYCANKVSWEGREFFNSWKEKESEGCRRAVEALAELNLEAMQGRFGKINKGKRAVPLHALNYGGFASAPTLEKIFDDGKELLKEVKEQIAAFNKSFRASAGLVS